MDEADAPGPPEAAIRRALAECMTVADIDDAMGWAQGTARRRRWRDPADGGLPPADAELGGVALWFRSTISRWRAEQDADPRPGEPRPAAGHEQLDADAEPEQPVPVDPTPEPTEPDVIDSARRDDSDESDESDDTFADTADSGATEPDPDDAPEQGPGSTTPTGGTSPAPDTLRSGFQLDPGQDVLAYVHGSWFPAQVRSRDRGTVVVDYQLAPGPLGARRQRVRIDQIRLDPGQG